MKDFLVLLALSPMLCVGQAQNYLEYHREVIRAEECIVRTQFDESLEIYRALTGNYDHVFLRDIKVAAQLSAHVNDREQLFYFLEAGMKKGWTSKAIMRMKVMKKFRRDDRWKVIKSNEDQFKKEFANRINLQLREEVKKMLAEDQKKAIRVALTPVKKWRDRYTNRKFVPNNRAQVRRLNQIIDESGYPGEKIIGDRSWAMVVISHNERDTIYNELRPKLYAAFDRGELSAIELAIIETWRIVVDTERKEKGFVIWSEEISAAESIKADSLRKCIGLRSIDLHNKLIKTEEELDLKFYLSPFHGGPITIKE